MAKSRIYSFSADNSDTQEHGTFTLSAASTDAAEAARWGKHNDANDPITCTGYVGPIAYVGWAEKADGFVAYVHVEPEMKTVINLMSGKEVQIPVGTHISCDPSSETYWSM